MKCLCVTTAIDILASVIFRLEIIVFFRVLYFFLLFIIRIYYIVCNISREVSLVKNFVLVAIVVFIISVLMYVVFFDI